MPPPTPTVTTAPLDSNGRDSNKTIRSVMGGQQTTSSRSSMSLSKVRMRVEILTLYVCDVLLPSDLCNVVDL